jgi:hypothetical protein
MRQVTRVEIEQMEPEVVEEPPHTVMQRTTPRVERSITVGPKLGDSPPSEVSSSVHTKLHSDSEYEPEVTEGAQSRCVSRVPTHSVSKQPTRQPTCLSRQPTAREQAPPPLIQSRRTTRRPTQLEQEPTMLRFQAEDIDEYVRESSPSPAHEPLIAIEEPEPQYESREESSARPRSAHTSILDETLAAYDVYNALPAIAPEPAIATPESPTISPIPDEEIPSEAPEIETVQPGLERRPTVLEADIPEDEPSHVDRTPTALLSRDSESLGPPTAHRITRFNPQIDDRVPRVLTVPRSPTTRPRSISVASGIEVAPSQPAEKVIKPTEPKKRRHKKVPNYPPEEQHPAAPAHLPRETPR